MATASLLGVLYAGALLVTCIILHKREQKRINAQIRAHIKEMSKEQIDGKA